MTSESIHPTDLRLTARELEHWAARVLRNEGASLDTAMTVAKSLVRADLRGVTSHGIMRVPTYVERIRAGVVNPSAQPSPHRRNNVTHWNAHKALGHAVAASALESALNDAENEPVVMVTISDAGHMGAIGLFTLAAAEAGYIAFMCQTTPPLMSLTGWSRPAIGNNPIAFGAPVEGLPPLVFDMATSEVSRGRIMVAEQSGITIPSSWANDAAGNATVEPSTALDGWLSPMSAHKGIGLAMMVQVLASALSAENLTNIPQAPGSFSAFLLVINPRLTASDSSSEKHVAAWITDYLVGAPASGRYPGWASASIEQGRRRDGIPFPPSALDKLERFGETVAAPFPSTCMWVADS